MNRKETVFLLGILVGLVVTNTALVQEHTFDCRQPLFSEYSSCSLLGAACIKPHPKNGAIGLWQNLKLVVLNASRPEATASCRSNSDSVKTAAPVLQIEDSAP